MVPSLLPFLKPHSGKITDLKYYTRLSYTFFYWLDLGLCHSFSCSLNFFFSPCIPDWSWTGCAAQGCLQTPPILFYLLCASITGMPYYVQLIFSTSVTPLLSFSTSLLSSFSFFLNRVFCRLEWPWTCLSSLHLAVLGSPQYVEVSPTKLS